MTPEKPGSGLSVAIIGSGLGGICLGLALKRRGFHDFLIYEKEEDAGGTWYQNRYPGCRSDVKAVLYSHSRHPKRDWSETHPPRHEILAYWQDLVDSQGLRPHIRCSHTYLHATWDPKSNSYCITFSTHNRKIIVEANILVSAIGVFTAPKLPGIPGLELFPPDRAIHVARWPVGLEKEQLKGKTVAVIGNGCSGSQLVASLAEEPDIQVIALSRSPQWVIANPGNKPQLSKPYSKMKQRLFRLPLAQQVTRLGTYLSMEVDWVIYPKKAEWIRRPHQKACGPHDFGRWMKDNAPAALEDVIVPSFPLGGKRIVRDGGYMAALNQPNVKAIWDDIDRITPSGLITRGNHVLDVDYLLFATGFDTKHALAVIGRDGHEIEEGGRAKVKQYHGVATPGFPNFFTLLSNNVSLLHLGLLFPLEVQAEYVATTITAMAKHRVPVLEVRESANEEYNARVDHYSRKHVWTETTSYYSDSSTRRNYGLWPLPAFALWADNLFPHFEDYVGGEALAGKYPIQEMKARFWEGVSRGLCRSIFGGISAGQKVGRIWDKTL